MGRDAPPYPVRRQSPLDVLVLRSAFRVACPRHRWLALGGLKPLQFPPGPFVVVGALGIADPTPPPDFLPRPRAHLITSAGKGVGMSGNAKSVAKAPAITIMGRAPFRLGTRPCQVSLRKM